MAARAPGLPGVRVVAWQKPKCTPFAILRRQLADSEDAVAGYRRPEALSAEH